MNPSETLDRIVACGVVPVIALESVEAARPLAEALLEGGLPVVEITFRTEAATEAMRVIAAEFPDLLLGAGTVLSAENMEKAVEAGADFGVAPGFNPAVVRRAQELGVLFAPGVATATDVEAALVAGCRVLKVFPAGVLGGPAMIKALSGPYKHTGVRFIPTGGVNAQNLGEYLAIETVAACGGTWLAKKDAIAAGDWAGITARCREAARMVQEGRGEP
jgi:2-dehydro-3-deoxyphosphogluconate aldolase/(4S)-4-hydroxy-2-oxoglutarate aldolase